MTEPSAACAAARRRSLAAPDEAGRLRLVAEEDVLGDAQVVDEVELLVDGGDPGLRRGRAAWRT